MLRQPCLSRRFKGLVASSSSIPLGGLTSPAARRSASRATAAAQDIAASSRRRKGTKQSNPFTGVSTSIIAGSSAADNHAVPRSRRRQGQANNAAARPQASSNNNSTSSAGSATQQRHGSRLAQCAVDADAATCPASPPSSGSSTASSASQTSAARPPTASSPTSAAEPPASSLAASPAGQPPTASTATTAAQAAPPVTLNSVQRLIRIVQLRKQRSTSSSMHSSDAPAQPSTTGRHAAAPALLNTAGGLTSQQQQQQQQQQGGASQAGRPRAKRAAALPAGDVLVTDTAHLNPVYRRIRLQELRLRLQEQLRGPQLQQQLLQVLQQHQQSGIQAPSSAGAGPRSPSNSSSSTGSTSLTQAADSSNGGSASDALRGPTQGLNSVQRTIRIAQLNLAIARRRQAMRSTSSSDNSWHGAPSTAAASAGQAVWTGPAGGAQAAPPSNTHRHLNASPAAAAASSAAAGAAAAQFQLRHPQQLKQSRQAAAVSAAESEAQLMQQLVEAGVPAVAAKALLVAADNTPAASPSSSCRAQVLLRLRQLQQVLGLPSIAAAARTMIKQPNLLARRPETLRQNVQQLSAALQLPQHSISRLFAVYPAALDMSPATVAARAAALAATLQLPQQAALEVACKCPRILGLHSTHLQGKLDSLQAELQLPTQKAAADIVVGFPQLLGLSSATLAAKWRRLRDLAARNEQWRQQLAQLLQQGTGGCLGRVLAAGPGVVDRLQYVLDAASARDVQSLQDGNAGSGGRGSASSSESSRIETSSCQAADLNGGVVGDKGEVRAATAAAAAAGVLKPASELRLTTLLLQSEATFTARHPEFVLWRLNQRSRPSSSKILLRGTL